MQRFQALILLGCTVALLGCAVGCGGDAFRIDGSGISVTETRQPQDFHRIEIRGAADADITVGQPLSVRVEADDNILPIIETEVRNDTLVISNKVNYRPKTPVKVRIAMPALDGATVSGSGVIRAEGINASTLAINIRGSGDVKLQGRADAVTIELSGSGNVDASRLAARRADVTLSGSGAVRLRADETLNASVSGSGDVLYDGKPRVNTRVTGSGSVLPI